MATSVEDQLRLVLIPQILDENNRLQCQKRPKISPQYAHMFRFQDRKKGQVIVSVVSDLDLCRSHASKDGCRDPVCNQLHICRYFFLDGSCTFKDKCKFGHDVSSRENMGVLGRRLLDNCSMEQLRCLVRSNNKQSTLPPICSFYNMGPGCTKGDKCIGIHVCKHFMADDCSYGDQCKRSHSIFDPQPQALLEKHGINFGGKPQSIEKYVKSGYKEQSAADGATRDSGDSRPWTGGQAGDRGRGRGRGRGPPPASGRFPPPQRYPPPMRPEHPQQPYPQQPYPQQPYPQQPYAQQPYPQQPYPQQHYPPPLCHQPPYQPRAGQPPPSFEPPFQPSDHPRRPRSSSQSRSRQASASRERRSQTGSEVKEEEICVYHLRSGCSYGERCRKYHSAVPYLWQYKKNDTWKSLPDEDNMEIERHFCDPASDDCTLTGSTMKSVHFSSMIMKTRQASLSVSQEIRRVSTMSKVKALPTFRFTTEWRWYWKDDQGTWQQFTIHERDFEELFLDRVGEKAEFTNGQHDYILDLKDMVQVNQMTKRKREIRRRPKFVSKQDVEKEATTAQQPRTSNSAVSYPSQWITAGAGQMDEPTLFTLKPDDAEYKQVEAQFKKTLPSKIITKIARIENMELWEEYSRMKGRMEKRCDGRPVNEQQLFHGTRGDIYDAICQQGFDWRMAGSAVGTLYGKGSYFARDAKYSYSYTDSRKLFLVRVLVGEYTKGRKEYPRPPPKDPSHTHATAPRYDSCVDSEDDPSIFVVFERQQSYPEYIIEYK